MSPIILRYTATGSGAIYYWNWDKIEQVHLLFGGYSYLLLTSGTTVRLEDDEARQVAEQLDALIDPPVVQRGEAPGDVWGRALRGDDTKQGA